jgi:hypothetical protein
MISGLLVLAVLLAAGAPASMALLLSAHHQDTNRVGQTIAVVSHGAATPVHTDDCDHGLPCCVGGQCVAHAYWIPAKAPILPSLSMRGAVGLPGRALSLNGIALQPSSPPPRAVV